MMKIRHLILVTLFAFVLVSTIGCGAPEGKNSDLDRPKASEKSDKKK